MGQVEREAAELEYKGNLLVEVQSSPAHIGEMVRIERGERSITVVSPDTQGLERCKALLNKASFNQWFNYARRKFGTGGALGRNGAYLKIAA